MILRKRQKNMKSVIFIIFIFACNLLHASPFDNIKGVKTIKKPVFKEKKCAEAGFHYSNYLTQAEICKYRDKGCLINEHSKSKVKMHCFEKNLSSCFENESWKTINELVGLKNKIEVGNVSKTISVIKGKMTMRVCAHYNE
jgi:hypothetical protein